MKQLDQGHFHAKQEVTWLTWPGQESNLGLPMVGGKEPFEQLVNSDSDHLHISAWLGKMLRNGSSQCMCSMNIPVHEHTWTALGCTCSQNSTCKASASCQDIRHLQVLVFFVKEDRSHQNHCHAETWPRSSPSNLKVSKLSNWHVLAGNQTEASSVEGGHSRKEPFKYRSLLIAIRNIYIWVRNHRECSLHDHSSYVQYFIIFGKKTFFF